MSIAILFSDLDPKKGGVQVSGIDVISAFNIESVRGIVYGSDPTAALKDAPVTIIESNKARLARRVFERRWRVDVALFWHLAMLKMRPLLRGFRGKSVLFAHGIEAWRTHGWLTRRRLRGVDLFLSNSDYTWDRLLMHAPFIRGYPHVTIPLGFGEPLEGVSPTPGDCPAVVVVGRLERSEDYKGHRELIAAWPEVLAHVSDAKLDVIGDGNLRPELEAHVRQLNLSDRVQFHGRVSEDVKLRLLSRSRCLALPSRGEGFGIVYLEAMRMGRPCLVSDCDAGKEVVNPPESGLAVDVGNPSQLSEGIVRLLSDGEEWRRWSCAARRRYEENFTAARFRERIRNAI